MNRELPEQIYFKNDIDRAFNMGVEAVTAAFEKTIGMSQDSQRLVLAHIKNMLIEEKTGMVMSKH